MNIDNLIGRFIVWGTGKAEIVGSYLATEYVVASSTPSGQRLFFVVINDSGMIVTCNASGQRVAQ